MSRFAPIAPLHIMKELYECGQLGTYHLLLAHEVAAQPDQYRDMMALASQDDRDFTVIMDNGVVELGKPVPPEVMAAACEAVPPNLIVLPDKVGDMVETIDLIRKWREMYGKLAKDVGAELMGVAQGNSVGEVIRCVFEINDSNRIETWGVPRWITNKIGSRMIVTIELIVNHNVQVHLLGFSDNLVDDVACARVPGVIGIDSSVPTLLGGMPNKLISLDNYKRMYRNRHSEEMWNNMKWNTHIADNVRRIRKWIGETT